MEPKKYLTIVLTTELCFQASKDQKIIFKREEPVLFSLEYNLLPKLISKLK